MEIFHEINRKMHILILSGEVWNDRINGNNVISNWFEGMEAEFANIYCEPGVPYNKCCKKYFQITDSMMAKSIITRQKAGKILESTQYMLNIKAEEAPKKLYAFLKSISGDYLRLARELIWLWGRYDISQMKAFIDAFNPDVIFTERMASCKMLRLEKIVSGICNVPMLAFTGDDEYSLRQFKFSPFYWINRFMVRSMLRQMVKKYKIYYTLSEEQLIEYKQLFPCEMKILRKCGDLKEIDFDIKDLERPIRIIYAGKLYMNRWKALADIAECLKEINVNETNMILEIYTKDNITKKQKQLLDDKKNSFIKGPVSQEVLTGIYSESDIALHVESQNRKQRLMTRLSFSTKIIDCLFSGCAVLAYCWKEQSGWSYLKREDAAICVDSKAELIEKLKLINENPALISEYAQKAYDCCARNHRRKKVQEMLLDDFYRVSTYV